MIDPTKVKELVTQAIAEQGAFLVDLKIGSDSRIKVLADHMEGISLEKLAAISRSVESGLDREEDDFEIEVSSPGIGSPFQVKEQYVRNLGHFVRVVTKDGREVRGDFTAFENDVLTLEWKERVPKPVGKGKVTVKKAEKVPLSEVKEASLEIRF